MTALWEVAYATSFFVAYNLDSHIQLLLVMCLVIFLGQTPLLSTAPYC